MQINLKLVWSLKSLFFLYNTDDVLIHKWEKFIGIFIDMLKYQIVNLKRQIFRKGHQSENIKSIVWLAIEERCL